MEQENNTINGSAAMTLGGRQAMTLAGVMTRRFTVMITLLLMTAAAWAVKPTTNLDVCRGEAYSIYVSGWAFDKDAPDYSLSVKVYVYSDAACKNEYTKKTLYTGYVDRPDVVTVHSLPSGSKPGFEGRIPITDPGTYYVKVYAIDIDQWGDDVENSSTEMSNSFNPVTVTTLTTIGSAAEWNTFVNAIKTGAEDFTGKTVKLTADIPTAEEIAAGTTAVTTITSEEKAFCGTFDGQGHTINVDLNVSGNEAAGLFCYVKGATIKNLTVTGTINNTGLYVGGLVGTAKGATIQNCTFAATINSSGNEVGAFVGGCNQIDANTPGNLTLQDCVFSGSIHYTGSFSCKAAGLVNVWNNTSLTIRNCLVSGSFTSERSGSQFYPIAFKEANATVTANVSNTYYLNTLPATLFGSNVASGAEGIAVTTTTTEKYDRTVVAIDGNTYYAVSPSYILTNGISSTEDWVDFAALVNQGNESFDGQTVKLMSDVSLSTMVGLSGHPFRGSFDGQSHTLNVSISNGSGASAPFASINGATIKGLTVTGSVSGGNHSSGLVGACGADRPNTISYCTINTNVSGAAYLGGIVGHGGDGTLTIQDCVYDGTISGFIGYAGGLLGWCGSLTLTIDNCLFKGTMTPASGGKSHPISCKNGGSTVISTVSKALYLNTVTPTATGNVLIPDAKGIPVNTSFVEGQWHNPVLAADYNIYYSAKHVGVISEIKIVGEGKTAEDYEDFESALPLEAYVPYSISEQIYTADEFGMAGAIRSIGFYSYRAEGTRNIDIYMVSTTLSSFNNGQIYNIDEICNIVNVTDIVNISVADKVFSGNVSFVKDGWTDIELDKLFEYDGVNNVLLVVNDKTGRETGEDISYFSVYKTSKHQSALSIDLSASFDPMNMSGITLNFPIKNHLRIVKEEDSPVPTPGKIHADEMTPYSAKLSWEVKGNSATYKLRYKTVNANSWTTITGVTSPYTLTGLTEETDYEVQMQAAYEAGISEWSESVYFSTQANNSAPYSLNISDVTSFSATLNWTGWHDSYNVRYRTSTIEYIKEDFEGFMSGFTNTGILAQNTDGTNQFIALGYESTETQYLISSQLDEVKSGSIVAFYQRYFFNANTFKIGYSSTTNQVDAFTWGDAHEAASSFTIYYEYIPNGTKFIAIQVQADNQGEAIFIENFNVFYPNGGWVTVTTNNPPLAITGLTPGIKYDWQVQGNKTGVGTTDWSEVAVFTTTPLPDIILADDGTNNVATIAAYNDKAVNVTLSGRTLYRDGDWNTLCLPFAVEDGDDTDGLSFTGTPLEGATVKELLTTSNLDANGTLTLNFSNDVSSIAAGKPYIVKWTQPDGYVAYDGTNAATCSDLVSPLFQGVTVTSTTPTAVTSTDGKVTFVGQYDLFEINAGNLNEIILLGTGNTLGYSSEPRTLHPFRAHFMVPVGNGGNSVKAYQISFGEGDETGIISIDNGQLTMDNEDGAWYSLDGRKLPGKPAQKGIYIHDGKKVVLP